MKIGSLFSGYGGLDMGVQAVLGGETAWFSEIDAAPSKILANHWPDVPNHGDVTTVDWTAVEPVDVLTGGFPCQDLSHAGRRAGMRPGTRSGLWADYLKAIDVLHPQLAVIENVRGLLNGCAESDSDLEPCAGCLGESDIHRPVLRALGRVLGDLALIGYDTEWISLSASDAGAPHGRFRVFVFAHPAGEPWGIADGDDVRAGSLEVGRRAPAGTDASTDSDDSAGYGERSRTESGQGSEVAQDADRATRSERRESAPGQAEGGRSRTDAGGRSGTPAADAQRGESWLGYDTDEVWGWADQAEQVGLGDLGPRFGEYATAIARWEGVTRPAPSPVNPAGRLAPEFAEWMMGLPAGHVTAVPDLSDDDKFKAIGNGVCPQQAALATATVSTSHSASQRDVSTIEASNGDRA